MRILQVISYGYIAGGAEKSVALLKEDLRRRGHEVMVVSSDHAGSAQSTKFSDVEFPEIDKPGTSLAKKTLSHLWHTPSHRALKAAVSDFHPDVVHFHVMGQLSPSVLTATEGVPGVLTVHGPEEYMRSILQWNLPQRLFRDGKVAMSNANLLGRGYYLYFGYLQRPLYAFWFRRCLRAIISPSKYMADILDRENFGVPVQHIYNGIDLPRYQPLRSRTNLLYVGRLEHVKGVDVLLKAMPIVAGQIPNVRLSVVGDGAMRAELESFAAEQGLAGNVEFCGWLDGDEVARRYTEATAVVIPSIWPENLPTVCIEALAMGRPVVGTNTGGIPELVQEGVTGRIVPENDAVGLAKGIVDLLSQPDLETISELCSLSVRNFKIDNFVSSLERLYSVVISGKEENL